MGSVARPRPPHTNTYGGVYCAGGGGGATAALGDVLVSLGTVFNAATALVAAALDAGGQQAQTVPSLPELAMLGARYSAAIAAMPTVARLCVPSDATARAARAAVLAAVQRLRMPPWSAAEDGTLDHYVDRTVASFSAASPPKVRGRAQATVGPTTLLAAISAVVHAAVAVVAAVARTSALATSAATTVVVVPLNDQQQHAAMMPASVAAAQTTLHVARSAAAAVIARLGRPVGIESPKRTRASVSSPWATPENGGAPGPVQPSVTPWSELEATLAKERALWEQLNGAMARADRPPPRRASASRLQLV